MKNSELNQLSIVELKDLKNRITEILSLKIQIDGKIKADDLKIGDTVVYTGGTSRIKNETFTIERFKKVNVLCKSNVTGQRWNLRFGYIEKCEPTDSGYFNYINLNLTKHLEPNGEGCREV